MVDTVDSKSAARKGVRVQVPPGVLKGTNRKVCSLFLWFVRQVAGCSGGGRCCRDSSVFFTLGVNTEQQMLL